MKRLLLLVTLGLAACTSVTSPTQATLVGDWHYRGPIQACRYSFRSDGTFSGDVTEKGQLIAKFTGQWRVQGNQLLYVYRSDAMGRIPAGATDQDQLLEVKKDAFVIRAADGSQRQYERLR
jgi:hypothetical protein